jgi:peptidoglycan hydrolase-like protein with peptidoglycan-binding domain
MKAGSGVRRVGGTVAAVAVLGTGAVLAGRVAVGTPPAPTAGQVPSGSAEVDRGTVTERAQLTGALGYDGSYQVHHQAAPGIVTWLPAAGATVGPGHVLYRVANLPVRLLSGGVPAYRDFAAGMSDGPDVRELEQNLATLGYRPGKVDGHFSAATRAAVRRWQAAWGLASWRRTGTLPLGSVVFTPAPLRVAQLSATLGGSLGPGAPVLTATTTRRVVTAQLPVDQQSLVRPGDAVQVSLTGGAPVKGVVRRVGRVATTGSGEPGSGGSGSGSVTVPVTIRVTMPGAAGDLDQAPVLVNITTAVHEDVLLVPVSALLPRPGGGYQVRLAAGGYVQVEPGLFDSSAGTVEVKGNLTAGERVEVPSA